MGSVVAPLCTLEIKQLVTNYSIFKRDPPVSRAAPVLRLPACTRWQGAVRTYCRRLEDAVTALVAGEQRVVVVLGRVQSAATALTAARKTGKRGRIEAAEAKARKETAALADARTATSAAGKTGRRADPRRGRAWEADQGPVCRDDRRPARDPCPARRAGVRRARGRARGPDTEAGRRPRHARRVGHAGND